MIDRHIAAIMFADIVDSSGAMARDEEGAVSSFIDWLGTVKERVIAQGGRVFNTAGDAILAEFPSAINALRAAMEARSGLPSGDLFRFALHVDDVMIVEDDLRGDGVNIAARLQSAAEPGDIVVTSDLYQHVRRKSPCTFDDLGEVAFKGIEEPLRILKVRAPIDRHRFQVSPTREAEIAAPEVHPSSVAVMPFKVASSADGDQEFLAEGLTDDLTLELSRLKSIFVSSRTAAASSGSGDPVELGRVLGVRYLVSGSIRKAGDRIRVNITLSSTGDGTVVWSDRIQRPFDEIMDVLDEITARIAATVSGRIEQQTIARARLKRPNDMTAYEHYLRGVDHHRLGGVTDDHIHKAVQWFEKAQQVDPNYGRPYAMQVCAWAYLQDFDIAVAEKKLAKALSLDPTDPEANRIMGIVQIKLNGDYAASRQYHERALELAPNDAYLMGRCAAFYIFTGESDKALALLEQAETLDPFLPVWVMEERVAANYALGRYEGVLGAARELPFQTRRTRIYVAASLVALGNLAEAQEEIRRGLTEDPSLSADYIRSQELYQDQTLLDTLVSRAAKAGLPHSRSG